MRPARSTTLLDRLEPRCLMSRSVPTAPAAIELTPVSEYELAAVVPLTFALPGTPPAAQVSDAAPTLAASASATPDTTAKHSPPAAERKRLPDVDRRAAKRQARLHRAANHAARHAAASTHPTTPTTIANPDIIIR